MSACLSRASGRTYGFDFDFVKSPSPSTRTSNTSSPSSTISESSDSILALATRKPRNSRKRPNQTYNEAAAMLSTAYPNLFPSESLKNSGKFTKTSDNFSDESSELLFPFQVFDSSSFLLQPQPIQHKPINFPVEPKAVNLLEKPCQSPGEISSRVNVQEFDEDSREDFDAESILDEEIGEGIDSIMGSRAEDSHGASSCHDEHVNPWTADSTGFNFGGKLDFLLRALRRVDEGNYWWNFPAVVDMLEISPEIRKPPPAVLVSPEKKKKKTKNVNINKPTTNESRNPELPKESSIPKSNPGLLLKLNYNEVLNAWSDRSSPFTGESPASNVSGNDVTARLAQIDLLWETGEGVMREASVMRYKEKRRTRLFSKKIRYQVRKVNADQRPRLQGRFARRPNCCSSALRS